MGSNPRKVNGGGKKGIWLQCASELRHSPSVTKTQTPQYPAPGKASGALIKEMKEII